MGSSAKTGKIFIGGSQEHFLHKSTIWDRTSPQLHIKCSLYVCSRVQGSQIFKWNSIISIHSKSYCIFKDFVVPRWSLCSPHCPHIVSVIPTSSLSNPHHPHVIPIVPTRSPCGPHTSHGCGLHCLHPMLSPLSPHCPRHPHVIPILSRSLLHYLLLPR